MQRPREWLSLRMSDRLRRKKLRTLPRPLHWVSLLQPRILHLHRHWLHPKLSVSPRIHGTTLRVAPGPLRGHLLSPRRNVPPHRQHRISVRMRQRIHRKCVPDSAAECRVQRPALSARRHVPKDARRKHDVRMRSGFPGSSVRKPSSGRGPLYNR